MLGSLELILLPKGRVLSAMAKPCRSPNAQMYHSLYWCVLATKQRQPSLLVWIGCTARKLLHQLHSERSIIVCVWVVTVIELDTVLDLM